MRIVDHTFYREYFLYHIQYISNTYSVKCKYHIIYLHWVLARLLSTLHSIGVPWVLEGPLSRGGFNAAVGNQTWLKHWPFGRLLSAVSQLHPRASMSHNHRFDSWYWSIMALLRSSRLFARNYYADFFTEVCTVHPNSWHPFGRGILRATHWQTIPEGPKTTHFSTNMVQGDDVLAPPRFCCRIFQDVYSLGN